MRNSAIPLLALALSIPLSARAVAPETIERAVAAEIARSTASLQQKGYPLPYYIGIRVTDSRQEELRCALGGVRHRNQTRQLVATPDVRVGSPALDNHPEVPAERYEGRELPDVDDEAAIRRVLWLKLDEEYKSAAADFLRKQALRVRRGKAEYDTDDMTREEPLARDEAPAPSDFDAEAGSAAARCVALSLVFAAKPDALGSYVELQRHAGRDWFLDSSGSRVRYASSWVKLEAGVQAMTADGMRLTATRTLLAPTLSGLPDGERLEALGREMLSDVSALQSAPSISPFNAPALLDPSVGAAVLQALASRLSGEEQRNPEGAQTFRDKLGRPVLPPAVTLEDDPTASEFAGQALAGHFAVDDQGVPARRVALIERGVLRGYLLSRLPVIGFDRSNGHGRAAPGQPAMGRASNLILRTENPVPLPRLLEQLRQEAARRGKPYGLYIRKARSWTQQDKTGQQQAFRLQPTLVYTVDAKTGRQALVRDLDMVGTPLDLMGRLLAAGDDPTVVNSIVEQPSGTLPASAVCPTLLLGEVEMQRSETKPERPMVLPPPK